MSIENLIIKGLNSGGGKTKTATSARINFTNRGFAKVLKDELALSDTTPDKASILAISHLMADVKIKKEEPVVFKTISDFMGLDYVGYIIEKERLDKNTGEWIRIDEYKMIGSASNIFRDTRVAYGQSYRYRIKSIIKITRKDTTIATTNTQISIDLKQVEANQIAKALEKNDSLLNSSNATAGITSKTSSGRERFQIDLTDSLALSMNESSVQAVQTSLPNEISSRFLNNLAVSDLELMRGTISNLDLQRKINETVTTQQEVGVEYVSLYYESYPSKKWMYVDVVESEPPPPPQNIKVVPNSTRREILLCWLKPANDQRDIVAYHIYRRPGLGYNWRHLATLKENETFYIDRDDMRFNRVYHYAVSCIDVHGIESFLSVQVEVALNPNYALEKQEKPIKWISGGGLSKDEVNAIAKKFIEENEEVIIAKRHIRLTINTKFNETSKNLLIKIRSLDTHEEKQIPIVLRNVNILPGS